MTDPRSFATLVCVLTLSGFLFSTATGKDSAQAGGPDVASESQERGAAAIDELIDGLDQGNLQEAFRLLRSDYINRDDLDDLEINRAALQGMLERLDFGAMILTESSLSERDSPFGFHSETITDSTAYIRFGRFREGEIAELDEALAGFAADEALSTLLLDLRSPQSQADFAIAAEILSRFRPPNELLFKIRRPGNERATLFISKAKDANWSGDTIILVDRETGNVAEIIAAVLRKETGCLVIGEPTPGLTVEYRDVPIGSDRILRYAIAEVILEDDSSLFRKGITPDLITHTPPAVKRRIFSSSQEGTPLAESLFLRHRPRLNEAALVARIDPEIDYYLLRSEGKPTQWDKPVEQDRVLRQAIDLLTTTGHLDGGQ